MPGVARESWFKSTSSETGMLRVCTRRMPSRPRTSGQSTTICRSKRPGRSNAGSSTSGRLVAATMITPSLRIEPVHLHQQLVQRLLALVVPAAETGAAVATHRVDLVDEDDARARCACPARRGRGRGSRPRRRTSRRNRCRSSRRTERRPRRRPPWRAGSCPSRAVRAAALPSESDRRVAGISAAPSGTR